MILTTGVIDDLQETINLIVEASELPLSIIIIGIGNGNFENMEKLDGDESLLISSSGKKRIRDIVQFVPFDKYKNDPEKLYMEVFAELPRQIVEFYYLKNLNLDKIKELAKNSKIYNKSKSQSYQNTQFTNNINQNQNNPEIVYGDIDPNLMLEMNSNVQHQPQPQVSNISNNPNISGDIQRSLTQGSIHYAAQSVNDFSNNYPQNPQIIYQVYENDINSITNNINQINFSNSSGTSYMSNSPNITANSIDISNNPNNVSAISMDIDVSRLPTVHSIPLDENKK